MTPDTADADRAAIEAVLAQEAAAWNVGDAEGFAASARPDMVFSNVIGIFGVGREPFAAHHRRILDTNFKGSTMTLTLDHLLLVRPDVAVVAAVAEVRDFAGLPPGVEPVGGALRMRLDQVMVREAGGWRVAAFHTVAVHPAVAASGPPGGR